MKESDIIGGATDLLIQSVVTLVDVELHNRKDQIIPDAEHTMEQSVEVMMMKILWQAFNGCQHTVPTIKRIEMLLTPFEEYIFRNVMNRKFPDKWKTIKFPGIK